MSYNRSHSINTYEIHKIFCSIINLDQILKGTYQMFTPHILSNIKIGDVIYFNLYLPFECSKKFKIATGDKLILIAVVTDIIDSHDSNQVLISRSYKF